MTISRTAICRFAGHMDAIAASGAPGRGRPGGEHRYDGDLRGGQVVPVQAGGASLRLALDDVVGGHDQIDAEVVLGLGYGLVDHLERVDGCHDHGAGADPPGLLEQRYLDVGITPALPHPSAPPVHRDAAADHHVDAAHVLDTHLASMAAMVSGMLIRPGVP